MPHPAHLHAGASWHRPTTALRFHTGSPLRFEQSFGRVQLQHIDWDTCHGGLAEMIAAQLEENGDFEGNKRRSILNSTAALIKSPRGRFRGYSADCSAAASPPRSRRCASAHMPLRPYQQSPAMHPTHRAHGASHLNVACWHCRHLRPLFFPPPPPPRPSPPHLSPPLLPRTPPLLWPRPLRRRRLPSSSTSRLPSSPTDPHSSCPPSRGRRWSPESPSTSPRPRPVRTLLSPWRPPFRPLARPAAPEAPLLAAASPPRALAGFMRPGRAD